ncbi:MAG TPA: choice-of-anchor B family protein [Longimicrobiaceae bacterium]|nr:choice-of-anchor B family protein [Longimicrobiaceae bacterium]
MTVRNALAWLLLLAAAAGTTSSPALAQDGFGAGMAVSGGDVLVGEPEAATRPGQVYVYRRTASGWAEAARITAPEAAVGDGFGRSLHAEGDALLVGGRGAAFLYRREGGAWRFQSRLDLPADSAAEGEDRDVTAVALSGDWAFLGLPLVAEARGTVHVFRRSGAGWSHAGELAVDALKPRAAFGVSLEADADQVLVGAPGFAPGGAVFAFRRTAAGAWERAATLAPPGSAPEAFGYALDLKGGTLAVGAPGAAEGAGAVYLMRSASPQQWTQAQRLAAPAPKPREFFGFSVAWDPDALWVGAPGVNQFRGEVVAFLGGPQGVATAGQRFSSDRPQGTDRLGTTLAAGSDVVVAGLGGADNGAGRIAFFQGPAPQWRLASVVGGPPDELAAITGRRVECAGGRAATWECQGVDLLSFLPISRLGGGRGVRTNDVWGWTDEQTGKEYAVVGMMDRTSFVDVTDPVNPVYVGTLPKTATSPATAWRAVKVLRDHVYVVSDGAGEHGLQVLDLTRLRQFRGEPLVLAPDTVYRAIHSAHSIVANPETGFLYSTGGSSGGETCGGGLHMLDARQPKNPVFVGCFADPQTGRASTGYTHDAQCVVYRGPDARYTGREICFGYNETALSIADVTDKAAPKALSRATYPDVGYTHQGWLSEDQRWMYMDDELDELAGSIERTRTLVWDVSDLEDPQLVAQFLGTTAATDHNQYVVGNRIFQSNYEAGLRVLDRSNPTALREVGFFDTVAGRPNTPGFGGSWSNYPFFRSGNVVVTSGAEGLFVVRVRD